MCSEYRANAHTPNGVAKKNNWQMSTQTPNGAPKMGKGKALDTKVGIKFQPKESKALNINGVRP